MKLFIATALAALTAAQEVWTAADGWQTKDGEARWQQDCREFDKYGESCYEYTGNPDDREGCTIDYHFDSCGINNKCELINKDGVNDCMPYLEDAAFWDSMKNGNIWTKDDEFKEVKQYWEWYHKNGGTHQWEQDGDAAAFNDECHTKHNKDGFALREIAHFSEVSEEDMNDFVEMQWNPCNENEFVSCTIWKMDGPHNCGGDLTAFPGQWWDEMEKWSKEHEKEDMFNYARGWYSGRHYRNVLRGELEQAGGRLISIQGWELQILPEEYGSMNKYEYWVDPNNRKNFMCWMESGEGDDYACTWMFYDRDYYKTYMRDNLQRWAFRTGNDDIYWNAEDIHRCSKEDYMCDWHQCEEWNVEGSMDCWQEHCYSEKCDDYTCKQHDLMYQGEAGEEWDTSNCAGGDDMDFFEDGFDFEMAQDNFDEEFENFEGAFGDSAMGGLEALCRTAANASGCDELLHNISMNVSTELAQGFPLNYSVINSSLNMLWNNSDVNDWTADMINDAEEGYGLDLNGLEYLVTQQNNSTEVVANAFDAIDGAVGMDWFTPFIENFEEEFTADECASHMQPGQPKYDRSEKEFDYMFYKDMCNFYYDCMDGGFLKETSWESLQIFCVDGTYTCMDRCHWYNPQCNQTGYYNLKWC